jgi:succinate dehydrogenase cytochrome b subunit
MADVERGSRPLSPHVFVYKWPLNAIVSILHRATGVAIGLVLMLVAIWFLAAAWSEPVFNAVDWVMTSWIGWLVLLGGVFSLWLHFFNGIRHLIWDTGSWFGQKRVFRSAAATVVLGGIMTVITLIVAIVW